MSAPAVARRRPSRATAAAINQAAYVRLPSVRKANANTLRRTKRATSAPDRRDGIGPGDTPSELLAVLPVWAGRREMLRAIKGLASQPFLIALCRKEGIAVTTWVSIMTNDIIDADGRTGRHMRTSQVVAGDRVKRCEKQIQRARSIAVKIGIMVETYRARELGRQERLELAAETHGANKQRGIPNEYAFTICPPHIRRRISTPKAGHFAHVISNVHLPPVGGPYVPTSLLLTLTYRAADASKAKAPPPAAPPQRRGGRPDVALAYALLTHPALQGMLAGTNPGSCVGLLRQHALGGWKAHELALELRTMATKRWISTAMPARDPWALIKALLSDIDPVAAIHLGHGPNIKRGLPIVAEACGHCDHGWLETDRGAYKRCAMCPPGVQYDDEDGWSPASVDEHGNPPF